MTRNNCFVGLILCVFVGCTTIFAVAVATPADTCSETKPSVSDCYDLVLQTLSCTNAAAVATLVQDENFYRPWTQDGLYGGYLDSLVGVRDRAAVEDLLVMVSADCKKGHEFSATLWFRRRDRLARMLLLGVCLTPPDVSQDCFVSRFQEWTRLFNSDERRAREEELSWVLLHRREIMEKVRTLTRAVWRTRNVTHGNDGRL